jgi:FkbM family methyltransferase
VEDLVTKDVTTPNGHPAVMSTRDHTSDLATVGATFRLWGNLVDEYHIPKGLDGWALDIGAHIGAVTVALLLDNPDLRVVAVEPVPANVVLLRYNLEQNGVARRCRIVEAAAWKGTGSVEVEFGYTGSEVAETHRWIGSVTPWLDAPGEVRKARVPVVTLTDLLRYTEGQGFTWVKSDCEGCEHHFLKGAALRQLGHIEGEWHYRDGTPEAFVRQLGKTHNVTWSTGIASGPFVAHPKAQPCGCGA